MSNAVILQVGANYDFLDDSFDWDKSKDQEKQIFLLEGGSGSAKSWDVIQFIITYCDNYYGWNKDILIGRDQYSDCKKTILKDFIKILKLYGIYNIDNHVQSNPQSYRLYGNIIYFSGINGIGSHGERHDVIFINEILETEWDDISQLNQRCNELFIGDYNPMFTDHWVYDKLEPREDCKLFVSTQLMNPFLPRGQRDEILAYEPTTRNISRGTADDYLWEVYGLGKRSAPEGLIFKYVNYIDEFPDIGYCYGMDFGFTVDPFTLVRCAETETDIYAELLCYEPIETPVEIDLFMRKIGIETNIPIVADSSDKYVSENKGAIEMVKGLQGLGWEISKVSKTKNIMYWLTSMKKKRLNIINNNLVMYAKKEAENYRMKTINGISINQPIDKFNHFIDATRYTHMALNQENQEAFW